MGTPYDDFLSSMDPAMAAQVMGLGAAHEKAGRLDRNMAMAQALRGQHHQDPGGWGFGGLQDAISNFGGAMQQKQIGSQEDALSKQTEAGRGAYLAAIIDALRNAKGLGTAIPPGVMPVQPPDVGEQDWADMNGQMPKTGKDWGGIGY